MNRRRFLAVLAAAGLVAGGSSAHEYTLGDLAIGHAYAAETPKTAKTGAGYLSITNGGTTPDRLLAIRTSFPRTEIHAVEVDAEGVTRMRPVEALDIPPGATVTLAPQGLHVMFMGLEAPLAAGASIPATLVFERAGEIAIDFKVEPRAAGTAHDMPEMTH
jgi:copper(I)-binding protein